MSVPDRLTCEEMFRRLEDYVDRELCEEELRRAEEHLQTCSTCLAEYRFEKGVVESVRDVLRRIDVPKGLMRRVRDRLARASDDPAS